MAVVGQYTGCDRSVHFWRIGLEKSLLATCLARALYIGHAGSRCFCGLLGQLESAGWVVGWARAGPDSLYGDTVVRGETMAVEQDLISSYGWLGIAGLIVFWFGVISLVVWLTGNASRLLHSVVVIKSVHTVVFVLLSGLLGIFLFEVIANRVSLFTWTAVTLFLAEGVILVANHGRCPLTTYAEKLGSTHGQITDIFLPKWFADQVFKVYTGLFIGGLVFLAFRLTQ